MSRDQLPKDDPRLTAYALGELDPSERETFARLLADSPEAQSAVREIGELAGKLATELRQEPAPALSAEQRTAILVAGRATAQAAHVPGNNISAHSDELAVPLGLSEPSSPMRFRASNHSVRRFASLVTIVAMVVVVVVMIPPTRQQTDLPILAEN